MCTDSVTMSGREPGNLTKEIGGASHVHSTCS
jgi:hypothetical protein